MAELGTYEEMKTALTALLLQSGATIDVSFETLGEAGYATKTGDVAVVIERTAGGVRYSLGESASARAIRISRGGGRG
ncbi:hypothetical protein ACIBG7_18710 [Nonomuraea sp. NPDC050328]|uniref:hypothetical protein n=1 Tax=Nonomuraea sp. NPDC050328 TaxID=3364361 RepID=UPI0037A8E0F9